MPSGENSGTSFNISVETRTESALGFGNDEGDIIPTLKGGDKLLLVIDDFLRIGVAVHFSRKLRHPCGIPGLKEVYFMGDILRAPLLSKHNRNNTGKIWSPLIDELVKSTNEITH